MNLPYTYWRGRYCPLIEVNLTYNSNYVHVLAYADTGATYSVFHSDYCEKLGIVLIHHIFLSHGFVLLF
jgi:hypothetical protein